MHLYLRAIIYMGRITRGIYCFYLYDLEMLYTPDTILEDPLKDPLPRYPYNIKKKKYLYKEKENEKKYLYEKKGFQENV